MNHPTPKQIEQRFQEDIAGHKMTILKEDGVYRRVRFAKPDSSDMYFDLITYPGGLLYRGDMGTYVFERTNDMFEFFRRPEHCRYSIDMRYWAEKVEAGDKCSQGNGITEFSKARFDEAVWEHVNQFIEEQLNSVEKAGEYDLCMRAMNDLRAHVLENVIEIDDNDVRCYDAANDYHFDETDSDAWKEYYGDDMSFEFTDWFEVDVMDYTHRFRWCCMALSWAMQTYDAAKAAECSGA